MPCYSPLKGYYSKSLTVNGKRSFVVSKKDALVDRPLEIPCGQCIGCKLNRSADWAVRISQEASLYEHNCFLTITYAPENLPEDGSLSVAHHQKFMKDLKNNIRYKYGKAAAKKIRFFMCGEYGEDLGRPHYHYCLLNFDFEDKYFHRLAERGEPVFRSSMLEKIWPYGFSEIGEVNFDTAAYVARYITKKITGPSSEGHYQGKHPEFTCMSRNPGIGAPFYDRFSSDIYPVGKITLPSGATRPPPRFYANRFELENNDSFIKNRRNKLIKSRADKAANPFEYEWERLRVKEMVHQETITKTLTRKI